MTVVKMTVVKMTVVKIGQPGPPRSPEKRGHRINTLRLSIMDARIEGWQKPSVNNLRKTTKRKKEKK
jgi:hypothetical protein